MYIDLCSLFSIGIVNTILKDCIEPQMKCPNSNITFWLYTRRNQHNPYQLVPNDHNSIASAPFVRNAPIKIVLHGYTGDKDKSPNTELRPAYMNCCNYNIISVDYNPIARHPCYIQAVHNLNLVGMCTAQMIEEIIQKHGIDLYSIHIIGFSLGAQAAGFISKYIKSGTINRITGLDPAFPMFHSTDVNEILDASDADFVDIVHTNSLMRGKLATTGTVDFFANDGITQPGCPPVSQNVNSHSSCSHARAPEYFAESINTKVGFYATKCLSWITYITGICGMFKDLIYNKDIILFGEHVPQSARGVYFFPTRSKSPYALGQITN